MEKTGITPPRFLHQGFSIFFFLIPELDFSYISSVYHVDDILIARI